MENTLSKVRTLSAKEKLLCELETQICHELVYAIANATILTYPYPHIVINDTFSEEVYQLLDGNWPDLDIMTPLGKTGLVSDNNYMERYTLDLKNTESINLLQGDKYTIWQSVTQALASKGFNSLLSEKFKPFFNMHPLLQEKGKTWNIETFTMINTDVNDYTIGPHTQDAKEVFVLLFYFPQPENTIVPGTSIFRPNKENMTCVGKYHYRREDFTKCKTIPYRRNTTFGFLKTYNSFHGVEVVSQPVPRRTLYFGMGLQDA